MQGRTLGIRMGLATALIICPMGTGSAAGVGQLTAPASAGANDAGAQLKRTREQQEQEQAEQLPLAAEQKGEHIA